MAAQGYILLTGSESRLAFQVALLRDACVTLRELGPDVKEALSQAASPDNAALAVALGFAATQQGADNAGAVKDLITEAVNDAIASVKFTAVVQRLR